MHRFDGCGATGRSELGADVSDVAVNGAVGDMDGVRPGGFQDALGAQVGITGGGGADAKRFVRVLDVLGEAALARAFERAKRRCMTVIAVTQRPALLRSVDKIMMIKDGAVQAIGPRDEILPMIVGQRSIGGGVIPQPKLRIGKRQPRRRRTRLCLHQRPQNFDGLRKLSLRGCRQT